MVEYSKENDVIGTLITKIVKSSDVELYNEEIIIENEYYINLTNNDTVAYYLFRLEVDKIILNYDYCLPKPAETELNFKLVIESNIDGIETIKNDIIIKVVDGNDFPFAIVVYPNRAYVGYPPGTPIGIVTIIDIDTNPLLYDFTLPKDTVKKGNGKRKRKRLTNNYLFYLVEYKYQDYKATYLTNKVICSKK